MNGGLPPLGGAHVVDWLYTRSPAACSACDGCYWRGEDAGKFVCRALKDVGTPLARCTGCFARWPAWRSLVDKGAPYSDICAEYGLNF